MFDCVLQQQQLQMMNVEQIELNIKMTTQVDIKMLFGALLVSKKKRENFFRNKKKIDTIHKQKKKLFNLPTVTLTDL